MDKIIYLDKVFSCNCGAHKVSFTYEYRMGAGKEDYWNPLIYLTIWKLYEERNGTFKERLRHIWNIIRYGSPYSDQVVLDVEELCKLRDTLNECLGFLTPRNDAK